MNNIVAIIQARCGSSRLPRKILRHLVDDKSLLEVMLTRVAKSTALSKIVIATTTCRSDDSIQSLANSYSLDLFRGSEQNVRRRFVDCAKQYSADVVVRLTSDCPFLDPLLIDDCVNTYFNNSLCDYISTALTDFVPSGQHVEVFSLDTLIASTQLSDDPCSLEHVTPAIYSNPDVFSLGSINFERDYSQFRLTVDYADDLRMCRALAACIDWRNATLSEIIGFLEHNNDIRMINQRYVSGQRLARFVNSSLSNG